MEAAPRRGTPADRGQTTAYAFDLERLQGQPGFEPVTQYLTYIQSRRNAPSHLLFVRYEDLDRMAGLEGALVPQFLERLDQLGVVISTN